MVGQWMVTKPSWSDEILDVDQHLMIANQIRSKYESMASKRPTKPNRSELDHQSATANNPSTDDMSTTTKQNIPQLDGSSQYFGSLYVAHALTNNIISRLTEADLGFIFFQ
ncbi:hypothetical protein EZV62_013932 [Acer yangbiense]|uniref:Uncharacterized protein n=1 Tax=Acer yangbiense TaxID=1000413 RepID=A0A5C7HRF8_9ROSI|nr:hypothetical protein EZV62_013932 [Acer yangbiense]